MIFPRVIVRSQALQEIVLLEFNPLYHTFPSSLRRSYIFGLELALTLTGVGS